MGQIRHFLLQTLADAYVKWALCFETTQVYQHTHPPNLYKKKKNAFPFFNYYVSRA